jgi:hypothetical protein
MLMEDISTIDVPSDASFAMWMMIGIGVGGCAIMCAC